jgi:hypothetical protein
MKLISYIIEVLTGTDGSLPIDDARIRTVQKALASYGQLCRAENDGGESSLTLKIRRDLEATITYIEDEGEAPPDDNSDPDYGDPNDDRNDYDDNHQVGPDYWTDENGEPRCG